MSIPLCKGCRKHKALVVINRTTARPMDGHDLCARCWKSFMDSEKSKSIRPKHNVNDNVVQNQFIIDLVKRISVSGKTTTINGISVGYTFSVLVVAYFDSLTDDKKLDFRRLSMRAIMKRIKNEQKKNLEQ